MYKEEFLRPRLVGDRFEDKVIPLEFLKDLSVLEGMFIEIAKWKFMEDHEERIRVPKNFTQGVELVLSGVEKGSAIPVISLVCENKELFPVNFEYIKKARDSFVSAIYAAENKNNVLDFLPKKVLGYFDRIGRSLRDNEGIEFTSPEGDKRAQLNRETRKILVMASSREELTEEIMVRGTIPEADQDKMSFEIHLISGQKISAPMTLEIRDTVIEAFVGYDKGVRVMVQGIGQFNRKNRLLKMESVDHVDLLEELDVPARLDELRNLRKGWLHGKGKALNNDGIDWLSETFYQKYPEELILPYVYPTAEGGVQVEWTLSPYEITLEVDLDSRKGHWHVLNLDTDEDIERYLELAKREDWNWVLEELKEKGALEK